MIDCSGAYWRGSEKNQQLLRIYGTAWETKNELKAYEKLKAEAARRDHRKLGKELDLFRCFTCYVISFGSEHCP